MNGEKIILKDGKMIVPDQPIIPFIEGDGTGPDIWNASVIVFDASVQKAYSGKRRIFWKEVAAEEEVFSVHRDEAVAITHHWNAQVSIRVRIRGSL